jgi:hypothetical protein
MFARTFNSHLPVTDRSSKRQKTTQPGLIAREESNLATMPFVRPKRGNGEGPIHFEWEAIGRDGAPHDFFQTFQPGNEMCLPGPTAGRVVMALLSVPPDESGDNFQVTTSLKKLRKMCQLARGGSTKRRLRRAIRRLGGIRIQTNAFWDAASKEYMDETSMSLFSSYHFNEGEVTVRWSPTAAKMISTWTKPVNINHALSLDAHLARRLYQISSLGIYEEGKMTEDLKILCHGYLGISQSRGSLSRMEKSLRGPTDELREKALLNVSIREDSSFRSGVRVCARPMERMLEIYDEIEDPQYWACHLANRGVRNLSDTPTKACRELIDRHSVEKARKAVKEYDRRLQESSDTAPVQSPGWMVSFLQGDVPDSSENEDHGEESPMVDYQSAPAPEETPDANGRNPIGKRVAAYLNMSNRDAYKNLHPEARRKVKQAQSSPDSPRQQEDAVFRKIGELFLEREGAESLPQDLTPQSTA